MPPDRERLLRALFDDYNACYAARDRRLFEHFSASFTGFTRHGEQLVTTAATWRDIIERDFALFPDPLGVQAVDVAVGDAGDTAVVICALYRLLRPATPAAARQQWVRHVQVRRLEADGRWRIVHASNSVPRFDADDDGAGESLDALPFVGGEVEAIVAERTRTLKALNRTLQALSHTDGLTGVANRRLFDRALAREWARGQRAAQPLALVMIDLDAFKDFNDHCGHVAGDDCLKTLAATLAAAGRRAGELVARYGGEEFVVLLPSADTAAALQVAERLQRALRELKLPHPTLPGGTVTVSLGVASVLPTQDGTACELVRRADAAMYAAKQAGRDCIRVAPGGA